MKIFYSLNDLRVRELGKQNDRLSGGKMRYTGAISEKSVPFQGLNPLVLLRPKI